jgi:Tol biopolymer transport system component
MTDVASRLSSALADRYVIERELGAGGMATVYLAHDVRHDRKVALKVLRPELAAVIGAGRFLAEIKTTANLQHPHILALFDSGEVDGTVFYVMPFVEGESLRDRLTREKHLPVADALRIAGQVAQALDYAHRRGVIHRDIKPENILLHDQSALVADFGIALAASRAGDTRMTETGMSLGTPHYMSPEQAMGERDLDARTDVYALGATLYEMLGGEPPFTGPTAQAIVARVLSEQPRPLSALRPTVPAHVDAAVRTALQKLPADRYGSAVAFGDALARPDPAATYAAPAAALPRGLIRWVPWVIAGAAVIAGMVLAGRGDGLPAPPASRLALLAPGLGGSGATSLQRQVALTPDGGTVIYTVVDDAGSNRLMRQALDAEAPSTITIVGQSFSVGNPVVAPDGGSLLLTNLEGRVYRLPMTGGTGNIIRTGGRFSNFNAFAPDGTVWATEGGGQSRLLRFGVGDTLLAEIGEFASGIRMQQVLPDGKRALAVMRGVGSASGPLALVDLAEGRATRTLVPDAVEGRFTAGHLVVALNNGSLQAVPFDARRGEVTGTPVTIATGVSVTGTGIAQIAVAETGTVAYIPEEPRSLVFVERSGLARAALDEHHNFHSPRFSPDGRRLAMDFNSADGRDVWVLDIAGGTLTRATFDRDGHDPSWTPDGRHLTYSSNKSGVLGLYRTRPGSAEPAESLLATSMLGWTGQWLADGSGIITVGNAMRGGTQGDIGIIRDAGHGAFEPLVASQFNEQFPAVSPDQRWLAFVSDQSGQLEVYVRPLDGDGELVQVSQNGGNEPVWSRDGSALFYRGFTAGGQPVMMAVRVRAGRTMTVTEREELFSLADYVGTTPHANYDVSPDGRYFVMVRRSPSTRIMIIQNLPALVERLRAGGGALP